MQSVIDWQPEKPFEIVPQAWLSPDKETYFFCDLHADAGAFLRSLKLSGLITESSELDQVQLTDKAFQGRILIGGDCFDKGPSNLQLFELLNHLREAGLDLILLAGNHDIRVYAGLLALDFMHDLRQAHFFVRMGRKCATFLAEVYQRYCVNEEAPKLADSLIEEALFPNEDWYRLFPQYAQYFMKRKQIEKEIKQIRSKRIDFMQACHEKGLNLNQVYHAALKAKQLFVDSDGEFAWFFQNLQLLHHSGSYLFCHAGVDDSIALCMQENGSDSLNEQFRNQMRSGQIFEMYYSPYGNIFRTKYRDKDWPFSSMGAETLRQQGIFALVNGHRSHENGQQLFVREGLLNFECDTQLNSNCRKKSKMKPHGEAVTIFSPSGTVFAYCCDMPTAKSFHPERLSA
ncbi:hypothetical protein [Thiomicrorhabdus sp.]|uniref:hypothetical protein n=1 Tax=Thiomicrorhabdus sp. TaxID=2039724 RepID=UPI0029C6FB22|nr:hypothetical protein [Thiomicrorhabdus sp.]